MLGSYKSKENIHFILLVICCALIKSSESIKKKFKDEIPVLNIEIDDYGRKSQDIKNIEIPDLMELHPTLSPIETVGNYDDIINRFPHGAIVNPETGALTGQWASDLACRVCIWQDCPDQNDLKKVCPAGLVRDACGCCLQCASSVRMPCHLSGRSQHLTPFPPCGTDLECVHAPYDLDQKSNIRNTVGMPQGECICTERVPVCGNNNVTYDNICDFRSAMPESRIIDNANLVILHDGPCRKEPAIDNSPSTIQVEIGDSASFRCELSGYPVPQVKWFRRNLRKQNNDEVLRDAYKFPQTYLLKEEWELPGYFHNAVTQMRGGPGTYQLTTWLTIDDVTPSDVGEYICRAINEEGQAEAVAMLKLIGRP